MNMDSLFLGVLFGHIFVVLYFMHNNIQKLQNRIKKLESVQERQTFNLRNMEGYGRVLE